MSTFRHGWGSRLLASRPVTADESTKRMLWFRPLGLSLTAVLSLACFLAWRAAPRLIHTPGEGRMPLHPITREPALVAWWRRAGYERERPIGADGLPYEYEPVCVAAWEDGSLVWGDDPIESRGR